MTHWILTFYSRQKNLLGREGLKHGLVFAVLKSTAGRMLMERIRNRPLDKVSKRTAVQRLIWGWMHQQEETIEEAWQDYTDALVELNSRSEHFEVGFSLESWASSNVNCALDDMFICHGCFAWRNYTIDSPRSKSSQYLVSGSNRP
jgi:hypothetical protein